MSENNFESKRRQLHERIAHAELMGGAEKLQTRKDAGILNARERLKYFFDGNSFKEIGKLARSIHREQREKTPADGKLAAFGKVDGRQVAAVANDMTVLGASSSAVNAQKIAYVKRTAIRSGFPLVFMSESSGSRIQDTMGVGQMGLVGSDPKQYRRMRETPWVSAVMGNCFGSSSWYSSLSDFVVMRKGSCFAVSSDRVTSVAINQVVDAEELGGWKLHSEVTGMVDMVVDTDEEALDVSRKFLSYLPSHSMEAPPRIDPSNLKNTFHESVCELVPEDQRQVYDMRKVIAALVDEGSYFPLKDLFAKSVVTSLARIDGRSVGIIASNPKYKGGAMDPDACDKAIGFLVLCDSFNIPLVMLEDTPGFLIGVHGERKKASGKIMNFMHALQMCTVPKVLVIIRKAYGQAYLNFGGGRNADESAAWFNAEISFMDSRVGANIILGGKDPNKEELEEMAAMIDKESNAFELADVFGVQHVISPEQTRSFLVDALELHCTKKRGVGKRLMQGWPTTY